MKHNFADQILGCVAHNVSAFLQTLLHFSFYVRAGHALCHFGTLPGGWIRSQEGSPFPLHSEDGGAFPTWQPYSQDCQLKPLLGPYLQVASHCAQCILTLHSCMSYDCMSQTKLILTPLSALHKENLHTHCNSSRAGGCTSRGGKHTSCAASQCATARGLHRLQNRTPLVQHQQA